MPLVYKWCQPQASDESLDGSGVLNPLDRVKRLVELTGETQLLQWLCQQAGGYFARNPSGVKSLDPLRDAEKILKELSDLLGELSRSLEDAKIDPGEAERIRKEWEDVKTHGESLVLGCERAAGRAKK